MEPDTQVQVPEVPKKYFINRATTFSKVLTVILFITLPIVTLYIGYRIGMSSAQSQDISEATNVVPSEENVEVKYSYKFNGEETGYWSDGVRVYLQSVYPDSSGAWIIDDRSTVFTVEGADPETFKVLESEPATLGMLYARDKDQVYAAERALLTQNPDTFQMFGYQNVYAIDDTALYIFGRVITRLTAKDGFDADTNEFDVYYQGLCPDGGDPESPYYVYLHKVSSDTWYTYQSYVSHVDEPLVLQEVKEPSGCAIGEKIWPVE